MQSVIKQVKQDLGIIDDTHNEVIEKYYKEVNKQVTEYLGNPGRTSLIRIVEAGYIVYKMKFYNMEYNPKIEKKAGLDSCIKDNDGYMNALKSQKGWQGANNRNIRAITESRQQRGVKKD